MRAHRARRAQALVGLVVVAHGVLLLAAEWGSAVLFVVSALVAQALDEVVNRRDAGARTLLRYVHLGSPTRALLREVLLLVLLASSGRVGTAGLVVAAVLVLAVPVARGVLLGRVPVLQTVSRLPVAARNVPLDDPELRAVAADLGSGVPPEEVPRDVLPASALPPGVRVPAADAAATLTTVSGLLVVGGGTAVALGLPWLVPVVALAVLGLTGAGLLRLERLVARRRGPALRERYLELVGAQVRAHRPEVVFYFSGTPESTYQARMWLPVLERMRRRVLVVLREPVHLETLGPTTLPVVCIPDPVDVMNFPLPTVRVALYAANVGKNIHLLREPRMKHVFVGHGDSDKIASVNPFSKVHDEIWVAGPAARDRYRQARVGVRDDAVVEVGRPQLDAIARAAGPLPEFSAGSPAGTPAGTPAGAVGAAGDRPRPLTVLYAPTWEGWTTDATQTSLVVQGLDLVRALLDPALGVRVVFKPHPLTGTVTPQAARALRAVERLLREHGAVSTGATPPPEPTDDPGLAAERAAAWSARFWAGLPADRHVLVTSAHPALYDCFDHADVLVGDISSVVSDFLASEKPYVVANPDALPEPVFRAANPSTAGGYLLTPGGPDVAALVATIRGDDPLRAARRAAREHLLGPAEPSATDRWDAAVERLLAVAEAEWGPVGERPAAAHVALPAQPDGVAAPAGPADPAAEVPGVTASDVAG